MSITVVGDCMVDEYLHGSSVRANPERPAGSVVHITRIGLSLGGAAAVAMLIRNMGVPTTLGGVIGIDHNGHQFRQLLESHGIDDGVIATDRQTTTKTRLVVSGEIHDTRVDREQPGLHSLAVNQSLGQIPIGDAIVIADHGKGACSATLVQKLISRAEGAHILVDPDRDGRWEKYKGCTVIKCNAREARAQACVGSETSVGAVAMILADQFNVHVVVTDGPDGIVHAYPDSTAARRVVAPMANAIDVTGAGDTVIATLAVAISERGMSMDDALMLAARTASEQVTSLGIQPVSIPLRAAQAEK